MGSALTVFVDPGDAGDPQLFFSRLTDGDILSEAEAVFEVDSFYVVDLGSLDGVHFQSLLLRRPGTCVDGSRG